MGRQMGGRRICQRPTGSRGHRVGSCRERYLTYSAAPPGWYPDPDGSGGQRYFDGSVWSGHTSPPPLPMYPPYGWPPTSGWKGAQIGRPPSGPGSLADPGRRLAARLLDGLVILPVLAALTVLAVVLVAPHAGPIFPRVTNNPYGSTPTPTPGIVWIYLAVAGAFVVSGAAMVIYETVATARFGRTLGKAWLHIRPIRPDGTMLGWGRSFGRVAIYWLAGLLNWLGALDPLWCLWDENRQCLHDKVVDTIVINDSSTGVADAVSEAAGSAPVTRPHLIGVLVPRPRAIPIPVRRPIHRVRRVGRCMATGAPCRSSRRPTV